MKNDLRVQLTKKMIHEAFIELLKEKPRNKITVKEICEKAQINRGTFYKHYYDTMDLMEELENEAITNFEKFFDSYETYDDIFVLSSILTFIQENRELIKMLYENSEKNIFLSNLSKRCTDKLIPLLSEHAKNSHENKLIYHYISGGTTSIIEQFIYGNINESPQALAMYLNNLNKAIQSFKNFME